MEDTEREIGSTREMDMVGGMTIGMLSIDLKMMGVIDMRKRTCATN